MATFKKSTARKTSGTARKGGARAHSTHKPAPSTLSESAQQIWLAGVGAFNRAQAEGNRLFEGLVKEGLNLEQTARRFAGQRAETVRDTVESTVGQARDRAADTWDRLEKVFEDRVQRALVQLGVPNREDLNGLSRRVDTLTAELRRQNAAPARTSARTVVAKKAAARKPAAASKKASATPAKAPAATKRPARKASARRIAAPKPPVAP